MEKNSKYNIAKRDFLTQLEQEKTIPIKYKNHLLQFFTSYDKVIQASYDDPTPYLAIFPKFLDALIKQIATPYQFNSYHKKILSPFDYYQFGIDFLMPLIELDHSTISGTENLTSMVDAIDKNENVILFANHQIEADPQAISILLEKDYSKFADDLIIVAGSRVLTDPLAVPFSLGCNLLCIHSKKHIDNPPENKLQKQLENKKTMSVMSQMLKEGGKAIYVAPSGGRDRKNEKGIVEVDSFDPQSIGMFYLMAKRAGRKTHFYPLALSTHHILPPPQTIATELGEERVTRKGAIHLCFGSEIDMENIPGLNQAKDKHEKRHLRAEYIWNQVNNSYQNFPI